MSVSLSLKEVSNLTYDPINSNFITSGEGIEVSNEKESKLYNIPKFGKKNEENFSDCKTCQRNITFLLLVFLFRAYSCITSTFKRDSRDTYLYKLWI